MIQIPKMKVEPYQCDQWICEQNHQLPLKQQKKHSIKYD